MSCQPQSKPGGVFHSTCAAENLKKEGEYILPNFSDNNRVYGLAENPDDSRTEPLGRGISLERSIESDATVKGSKRFADTGGWGYFNFNHHEPKAPTDKVKAKSECAFCHIGGAKRDEVWTQFYRLLEKVPLPQGSKRG